MRAGGAAPAASAVARTKTAWRISVRASCDAGPAASGRSRRAHSDTPLGADDEDDEMSERSSDDDDDSSDEDDDDRSPSRGNKPSRVSNAQNATALPHSAAVVAAACARHAERRDGSETEDEDRVEREIDQLCGAAHEQRRARV